MTAKTEAPTASNGVALPTIDEVITQFEKSHKSEPNPEVKVKDVVEKTIEGTQEDPAASEEAAVKDPIEASEADKAVAEAKEIQKKRDPQAARFAALARRERETRQLREQAEARQKEIETRERAIQERESRLAVAKKNPIDLLKENGFSYADATQAMLGGYKPAEPDPVTTKLEEKLSPIAKQIEELRGAKQEMEAALQELQTARVEVAQREVRQAIEEAAKTGGYEFISNVGDEAYTLVQDVISAFYKKHKRILNYNEACDRVEKYYEDRFETLAKASKVQSRFAPATSKETAASTQSPAKSAKESKTLTQSLSSSARAKVDVDKLSRQDALAHLATSLRYLPD